MITTPPTASASRFESIGPVEAERHDVLTRDGVPLAVTRLPAAPGTHATPVVLVHGSYTRRNFWVSPKGVGLGPHLLGRGFDVWIPELRGHGRSPKTHRFSEFTAEDHMRYDLPAVQQHVRGVTGQREFLLGHSAGGLFCYGALAAGWLKPDLRGLVVLGAQIARGDRILKVPPVVWFMRLVMAAAGHFPAQRLGYGPEVEPAGEMVEYAHWKGLGGRWETRSGRGYHDTMHRVTAPLLAFGAQADRSDPHEGCRELFEEAASVDRRYVLLGTAHGYAMDYGHVEMVVSKEAQAEVWPLIAEWMEARR